MSKGIQLAAVVVALSCGGLFLWHARAGASVPTATGVNDPPTRGAPEAPPVFTASSPRAPQPVDLVFAIDTTGSMSGLIAGAKAKIWEIARHAQQGQPAPDLRVGLVAYRDRGDAYVTRVVPLTRDLDSVYAKLTEFQAQGGGDTPEHVLKGLRDAVDEPWSDDPQAVKIIYLVGDAPPHYDYHDGITLEGVLGDATKKGIRIDAIRCGTDKDTEVAWETIAHGTDGEVSTIEQSGGVAVVATPFDAELARLNAALSSTEVHYGSAAERREADKVVAQNMAAAPAAQAERASFYGSAMKAKSLPTKKDLAASSASQVASLAASDLPDEMQVMSEAERVQFVEKKRAERAEILAKVQAASAKREAYLRDSAPAPAASSFDSRVYDSLKKAGAKKGMSF
jgi:hypothetical protein